VCDDPRAVSTVVIKLGSSIVADDAGRPRAEVLAHVCEQAAALHCGGRDVAIVTSGAIARGMGVMRFSERPRAIDELQAASAVGQGKLYAVYDELLRGHGIASAQVLLTFHDISGERAHYLNARQTLRKLIEWRVVPVINENDTTATDEITFGDNDFLAAQVSILLGADLLVLLTSTDGLYTADPRLEADARPVPLVEDFAALDALDIRQTTTTLGSGGMRSKVVAAEMATAAGIPTVIANGRTHGAIAAAATGASIGTRFAPQQSRYSSFKLWLKYAKPSHGTIRVDGGAARALREGGTSLLPVGVVAVDGGFDAGDAVEVVHDGAVVGKGIASCSAADLRRVMGLKSEEARALLPHHDEETIHRDHFVLSQP
jgi:glutamate 5-kinase